MATEFFDGFLKVAPVAGVAAYPPSLDISSISPAMNLHTFENQDPELRALIASLVREISPNEVMSYPFSLVECLHKDLANEFSVSPAQLVVGLGVDGILKQILSTLMPEGVPVGSVRPVWRRFHRSCVARKCPVQFYERPEDPLGKNGVDSLLVQLQEKPVRMFYLVNPDTIVPRYIIPAELERLANFCFRAGTLLLVDESYIEFKDHDNFSAISLIKKYPNVVVLRSFSKAWGLAGFRVGVAIGDERWMNEIHKGRHLVPTSGMSLEITRKLLRHKTEVLRSVDRVRAGREFLCKSFRDLGFDSPSSPCNLVIVNFGQKQAWAQEILDKKISYVKDVMGYNGSPGFHFIGAPHLAFAKELASSLARDLEGRA